MTTAIPTTPVGTTVVPTTPPDIDINLSPLEIVTSLSWSNIVTAPGVFYYSFNPNLDKVFNFKDNPIVINLTQSTISIDPVGILTYPIELTISVSGDSIDSGKFINLTPITLSLYTILNKSKTVSLVGVATSDSGGKKNFVRWSKIGYVDFTIDETNVAGERPMDFSGYVHSLKQLDNKVIVYGENGISAMIPSGVNYGIAPIYKRGTKGRYASCGDDKQHFFIDDLGQLHSLNSQQLTKLDFSEFLSLMSNPVMTYDQERQMIYITDNTYGYVYSIENNSLGNGPVNITGYGYKSGTDYLTSPAIISTPKFEITTDIYDFGTRKLKTIEQMEVGTDLTQHLYASLEYRKNYSDEFKQIPWTIVTPTGIAYLRCFGVEFRFKLKSYIYEYFELDWMKIKGFIHNYSYRDN